MIRAPAHHARPEPGELRSLSHGVRLTREFPAPEACREVAEVPRRWSEISLPAFADAAMRHLVGPHMFLEILGRIERRTSFEQSHRDAQVGQHFRDGPTT